MNRKFCFGVAVFVLAAFLVASVGGAVAQQGPTNGPEAITAKAPATSAFTTITSTQSLGLQPQGGAVTQGPTNNGPELAAPNQPVGSGFTYQGQLKSSGSPVNGNCDFQFNLWGWNDFVMGKYFQVGSTITGTNVAVTNGLFNVYLDFGTGADIFTGDAHWLGIKVRCPAGSGSYTDLGRQGLSAAPYALSLRPGAVIQGAAYQTLKVSNNASTGSVPAAVLGEIYNALDGIGVFGVNYTNSYTGTGVFGQQGPGFPTVSFNGGVVGVSTTPVGRGVVGEADNLGDTGVLGLSANSNGVEGQSTSSNGAVGSSTSGNGVYGHSTSGYAGYFAGNVDVTGNVYKSGGSFKIDDPLDPANKYLYHSFVESPDMLNIYNGNITTDANGDATVVLPDYFEALNRDFRYQLTVIGQFAQVIVQDEITGNRFTIKTDKPNVKVSWQVTGIRQDAWANAHRIPVEEDKPAQERGSYLHPELFGQPVTAGIDYTQTQALELNTQPTAPTGQP